VVIDQGDLPAAARQGVSRPRPEHTRADDRGPPQIGTRPPAVIRNPSIRNPRSTVRTLLLNILAFHERRPPRLILGDARGHRVDGVGEASTRTKRIDIFLPPRSNSPSTSCLPEQVPVAVSESVMPLMMLLMESPR
jgi:hypothetical protein